MRGCSDTDGSHDCPGGCSEFTTSIGAVVLPLYHGQEDGTEIAEVCRVGAVGSIALPAARARQPRGRRAGRGAVRISRCGPWRRAGGRAARPKGPARRFAAPPMPLAGLRPGGRRLCSCGWRSHRCRRCREGPIAARLAPGRGAFFSLISRDFGCSVVSDCNASGRHRGFDHLRADIGPIAGPISPPSVHGPCGCRAWAAAFLLGS